MTGADQLLVVHVGGSPKVKYDRAFCHYLNKRASGSVMRKLTICAIAVLTLAACGGDKSPAGESAEVADADLTGNRGQVLSSVEVPGYTYIEVRNNGRNVWLAGNSVDVAKGDVITWGQSAVMHNFQSTALDRVFEEIIFVSGIYPGDSATPQVASATSPQLNSGKVLSAENASGYSYVEIETGAGDIVWLAAPMTTIEVGQNVVWQGASKMVDFTSPSLGRTFPEILFVNSLRKQ